MKKLILYPLAFSLIELLVSLIIISLILASFSPILTKQLKHQNISLQQNINCKKFDERCLLCNKTSCTLCSTQLNTKAGKYVDPSLGCNYKNCPTGCQSCNKDECLTCIDNNYILSPDKKSCIDDRIYPSVENCAKINAVYLPAALNGLNGKALCVSKFNAGDVNGPMLPNTVQIRLINNSYSDCTTGKCCWQGQTTDSCQQISGYDYNPCTRTVCNYYASVDICKQHFFVTSEMIADSWRLPTLKEVQGWTSNTPLVTKTLQLCDSNAGYGYPACAASNKCSGALWGNCYPYAIHATPESGFCAEMYLTKGLFYQIDYISEIIQGCQDAQGVRCVIESIKKNK